MTRLLHDPQARLDYGFDWSAWLAGDTIAASAWSVTPAVPTLDAASFDATTTTVWVAGGVAAATYRLTNHITTAAGRQEDRTIVLFCQQR